MDNDEQPNGVIDVDANTVKAWFDADEVLLVDVRETSEYDQEHIPGARLMPLSVFDPSAFPVLTDKKVVIHCALGRRSETAGEQLIAAGLKNVKHMLGGIADWKARGYATQVQAMAHPGPQDIICGSALAPVAATTNEQLCPPPGRVLVEEFLEPLGIGKNELANDIGVLPDVVDSLVNGQSQVTTELSLRLSRYFSTAADFWLHVQIEHNLEVTRRRVGTKVRKEVTPRTMKEPV